MPSPPSASSSTHADRPGSGAFAFTVVVPTYNEAANIAPLLARLDIALDRLGAEILFVDDSSPDGTAGLIAAIAARRPDVRLLRRAGRRGLASAVIDGMMAAAADIVAVIDADNQHDAALLPAMLGLVRDGAADLVIGSRYCERGSTGEWRAWRRIVSLIGTRLSALTVRQTLSDPLSGFFAIRRDRVVALRPQLSGRGFKILLDLLTASPTPLRTIELPYEFRARAAGESKFGIAAAVDHLALIAPKLRRRVLPSRVAVPLTGATLAAVTHRWWASGIPAAFAVTLWSYLTAQLSAW